MSALTSAPLRIWTPNFRKLPIVSRNEASVVMRLFFPILTSELKKQ